MFHLQTRRRSTRHPFNTRPTFALRIAIWIICAVLSHHFFFLRRFNSPSLPTPQSSTLLVWMLGCCSLVYFWSQTNLKWKKKTNRKCLLMMFNLSNNLIQFSVLLTAPSSDGRKCTQLSVHAGPGTRLRLDRWWWWYAQQTLLCAKYYLLSYYLYVVCGFSQPPILKLKT